LIVIFTLNRIDTILILSLEIDVQLIQ